jgi:hypothetical protein
MEPLFQLIWAAVLAAAGECGRFLMGRVTGWLGRSTPPASVAGAERTDESGISIAEENVRDLLCRKASLGPFQHEVRVIASSQPSLL